MVLRKVQLVALLLVSLLALAKAGCGCLKCSKNLKVVSPPGAPIQIIYRGEKNSCHQKRLLPYSVQIPIPCVQKPPSVPSCGCASTIPTKLDNLYAVPDRIVMPAPDFVVPPPVMGPIFNPLEIDVVPPPLPPLEFGLPPPPPIKPCGCRYASPLRKRRQKRSLSPSQAFFHITQFLPAFLRVPLQKTFRIFLEDTLLKHRYNVDTNSDEELFHTKTSGDFDKSIFLQKLRLLNDNDYSGGRTKREVREITLPFYQIDFDDDDLTIDYEGDDEDSSVPSSNEIVGGVRHNNLLKPFHLNHMIPHSPLFYFLNAPIRLIHHLHNLKKHFNPLLKALPKVLFTSKNYFKNFGSNIQGHLLNIASNLMGDFSKVRKAPKFNRFKRTTVENPPVVVVEVPPPLPNLCGDSTNPNQNGVADKKPDIAFLEQTKVVPLTQLDPNLALSNFYGVPETPPQNTRTKRFIMKVVDEDEVQEFLREKLEDLEEPQPIEPPSKDTKKLKIKPLTSKIIIDDNGRPFMELNGMKRPLFNRPRKESTGNKIVGRNFGNPKNEEQDVKVQITNLIKRAKMSNQNTVGATPYNSEMHVQIIKDKITQILGTIQDLIDWDFGGYTKIQDELMKLQALKESVTEEWKNILIEGGGKSVGDKIKILNALRDLQGAKDAVLAKVAGALKNTQNHMGKRYVKILVRLQKLQCIIYKTLEDFEEKIKLGSDLEVSEEIKRIDSLEAITFTSTKKEQVETEIKGYRDEELQKQIELLEDLQKLLEMRTTTQSNDVISKINEAARLIWETKNINRLQKDSIKALNEKLTKCQKLRKELKILFDLQKQLEEVEEKQNTLIEEIVNRKNTIRRPKRIKTPQKLRVKPRTL